MDKVIKQISEIESAAAAVMDAANERKKSFAQEMADKTAAFDRELDAETERQLDELRRGMETDMKNQLARQKDQADQLLTRMTQNYKEHHTEYVSQLFEQLLKE